MSKQNSRYDQDGNIVLSGVHVLTVDIETPDGEPVIVQSGERMIGFTLTEDEACDLIAELRNRITKQAVADLGPMRFRIRT